MGRSRREQPAHRRSIHYRRGFGTFCPQGSFPCSRGSVPEVPYSDVPPCALSRTPHLSRPPCAFLFVSVPGRTASAARAGTVTALEKAPRSWLSPFAACLRCKGAGHEVFFFFCDATCLLFIPGLQREERVVLGQFMASVGPCDVRQRHWTDETDTAEGR